MLTILLINCLLVLLALVKYGDAASCFKCEYNELKDGDTTIFREGDPDCAQDTVDSYVHVCDGLCQKTVVYYRDTSGKYRGVLTLKSCEPACVEGNLKGGDEGGYADIYNYCCTGDLCNSAPSVKSQHFTGIFCIATILALLYF